MKIIKTNLEGLFVIEPKVYRDERGFFLETYQMDRYKEEGIDANLKQDNQSRSRRNVLRGLHFQIKKPQAQLLTVLRGHIFDVCVDLRKNSPTFSKWFGVELNEDGPRQIYMPPGFAHGFYVLSEWADLNYKVSENYNNNDEGGILWSDENIGINWPNKNPIVSFKDSKYLKLSEINFNNLPNV
jgi:dTDP-4-dehydrorhamnose 3,5-epimerase